MRVVVGGVRALPLAEGGEVAAALLVKGRGGAVRFARVPRAEVRFRLRSLLGLLFVAEPVLNTEIEADLGSICGLYRD